MELRVPDANENIQGGTPALVATLRTTGLIGTASASIIAPTLLAMHILRTSVAKPSLMSTPPCAKRSFASPRDRESGRSGTVIAARAHAGILFAVGPSVAR
jgi:hypothetical protein